MTFCVNMYWKSICHFDGLDISIHMASSSTNFYGFFEGVVRISPKVVAFFRFAIIYISVHKAKNSPLVEDCKLLIVNML